MRNVATVIAVVRFLPSKGRKKGITSTLDVVKKPAADISDKAVIDVYRPVATSFLIEERINERASFK